MLKAVMQHLSKQDSQVVKGEQQHICLDEKLAIAKTLGMDGLPRMD